VAATQDDRPDIDAVVARLRERVEQRRREGLYPEDLDRELHEHQRRIAAFRSMPDFDKARRAIDRVDTMAGFTPERIETESRVPGGKALHDAVAKLVSRQTAGVLEQVQFFADSVRDALHELLALIEDPAHVHADLVGQIDAVFDRIASFERGPSGSKAAVADLRKRVEELEVAEARRCFNPFFGNAHFEETFRGSRQDLLARYRDLAQQFHHSAPVLDVGCGRGEFLELLKSEGIPARGVELDPELVEAASARGLDVKEADGLSELASLEDGSLGGVVMIQVIEHLTPQQVLDIVLLARDKVRPGGKVVVETVNPQSLYVFAHAFYVDPTHTQPIHPAYLEFVFRQAGFGEVGIDWRSAPSSDESLVADPDAAEGSPTAANVERLNRLLFAPQDYALIATR
jgi:2-polyprenyl-3-methyl-5-hydroxy-6-metoxy-1,4-benzoquinol methylase